MSYLHYLKSFHLQRFFASVNFLPNLVHFGTYFKVSNNRTVSIKIPVPFMTYKEG